MRDVMTESEFSKHLDAMTAYSKGPRVMLVRCTCPTPEGCTCVPCTDEEPEGETCDACLNMKHTDRRCMIYIFDNLKTNAPPMKLYERELGLAVNSYCSEHGIGDKQ